MCGECDGGENRECGECDGGENRECGEGGEAECVVLVGVMEIKKRGDVSEQLLIVYVIRPISAIDKDDEDSHGRGAEFDRQ